MILSFRAIQLPQQPLPILQTLQSQGFKPVVTTSNSSNGQIPIMAANISSIMPRFAATAVAAHQVKTWVKIDKNFNIKSS